MIKQILIMIPMTFGLILPVRAQQAITAAGGDASGSGGTVAYSAGQAAYTTHTGPAGSVSQGVQQAYEIIQVGIKDQAINISLSVFPNPTADNLTLQVQDFNNERMNYHLLDMNGKLLDSKLLTTNSTQINMSALPSAAYFIQVIRENKKVQTFKVIKN
jgi:hypothetical protein